MEPTFEISTLKIAIPLTLQALREARGRVQDLERLLSEARNEASHLQKILTNQEVELASLEGRIQKSTRSEVVKKKVEKAVEIGSAAFLKQLSPSEKEALVASLLSTM